jgi:hypothetical protein
MSGITPLQNIGLVCPCQDYLGWVIVYIVHGVGHMILTQSELVIGCEPKVLSIQWNVTRVVYRVLCQVELNLKRSCQHLQCSGEGTGHLGFRTTRTVNNESTGPDAN